VLGIKGVASAATLPLSYGSLGNANTLLYKNKMVAFAEADKNSLLISAPYTAGAYSHGYNFKPAWNFSYKVPGTPYVITHNETGGSCNVTATNTLAANDYVTIAYTYYSDSLAVTTPSGGTSIFSGFMLGPLGFLGSGAAKHTRFAHRSHSDVVTHPNTHCQIAIAALFASAILLCFAVPSLLAVGAAIAAGVTLGWVSAGVVASLSVGALLAAADAQLALCQNPTVGGDGIANYNPQLGYIPPDFPNPLNGNGDQVPPGTTRRQAGN